MLSKDNRDTQHIIKIQRQIRSTNRRDLHFSIFKENPSSLWPTLKVIPSYYQSELHYRLEKIIANITEHQKIINGKQIYHYTSLPNLASILQHQYFYGNDFLMRNNISFHKNAFHEQHDGDNGDAKIICFCPGQVDYHAYIDEKAQIKPNRCRLTMDINNTVSRRANYNEFFKISDFLVNWNYTFSFGYLFGFGHLDINFVNSNTGLKINLLLDKSKKFRIPIEKIESIEINKNEMIFYGNIFGINRFCAIQLFNIINKIKDEQLKQEIFNCLNELNETELTNLIIAFSQSLTVFAEYNFNTALSLKDIKIKEVLIIDGSKEGYLNYDLSELDDFEYDHALKLLSTGSFKGLYRKWAGENNTIYKAFCDRSFFNNSLSIFGTKIGLDNNLGKGGYSLLNDLSDSDEYVETRTGVSGNILLKK